MATIILPALDLQATEEEWSDLVRKFSIEGQYEGYLLMKDFLELTVTHSMTEQTAPLADTFDLIRFRTRQKFAAALRQKYRQGSEFADDEDAQTIFDKVFVSAESVAMNLLKSNIYTVDMLAYIEVYYWVVLQLLRKSRGERLDGPNRGNQARLGDSIDLVGDEFLSLAGHFLIED